MSTAGGCCVVCTKRTRSREGDVMMMRIVIYYIVNRVACGRHSTSILGSCRLASFFSYFYQKNKNIFVSFFPGSVRKSGLPFSPSDYAHIGRLTRVIH